MTRSILPPSLDAFLDQRVPRFSEPPDPGWFSDVAQIYSSTPADVEAAFRAKWSAAHGAVPAVMPKRTEPSTPVDSQHPFDRVLEALRARGCRILPKRDARGRESKRATCPAHEDSNPSLVVTADGPNALVHCFGGCPTARVVTALGLKLADLFSGPPDARVPRRRRTRAAKPAAAPKLSPEERLARKRVLTAARTRRWRERRHAVEPVTHLTRQNIRSVTCDAVTLGDAPNVLPVTSHVESISVSSDLGLLPINAEEGPRVLEISMSLDRWLSFDLEIHQGGDHDGDDDDDAE